MVNNGVFPSIFKKRAISLFVYYNVLPYISKTTKVTKSALDNFFLYTSIPFKWHKNQTSSTYFFFLWPEASGHVPAKCGPGRPYVSWTIFDDADSLKIAYCRAAKKIWKKYIILWPQQKFKKLAFTLLGVLFREWTVRSYSSPCNHLEILFFFKY